VGNLAGNASVRPLAKYGTPRVADHNGAITSLDASVIARVAVGLLTPSPNQIVAGDVTGNGSLGALDASYVARFSVDLVDHFPVAEGTETMQGTGSDWKFMRCDAYVFPGDPACGPAQFDFTPMVQAESDKNFYAVLYGDVTGNWQPAGGLVTPTNLRGTSPEEMAAMVSDRALAAQLTPDIVKRAERTPAGPAELSVGEWTGALRAGERRQVTISLANADGILGLDLVLKYDPTRVAIKAVDATGIGTGQTVVQNSAAGTTRIAMYGVLPLSGSGAVLNVTVEGVKSSGAKPPLTVSGLANEGAIPLVVQGKHPAPATRR
jgi:hypothetical protein